MKFFNFLFVLVFLVPSVWGDIIFPDENRTTDSKEHKIHSTGGESLRNRVLSNEIAINFLKKEVQQLKKQLELYQKKIDEISSKKERR